MQKEQKFVKFFRKRQKLLKYNLTPLNFLLDQLFRVFFSCDIPATVQVGDNPMFAHNGLGVVMHWRTVIGNNVKIYQHVTIGFRNDEGPPKIGDNVLIGAGASILGKIQIGNNVKIGANAVVLNDVPDNSIAVGAPAKIIPIESNI